MEIKQHDEYKELVPKMTNEEFDSLKESIEDKGLLTPITLDEEGFIIDGYHRFKACKELGIEPDYNVKQFDNEDEKRLFIIETNLQRRHLNAFQKIKVAMPLIEIEQRMAKKRERAGGIIESKGSTNELIGKKLNIGGRTVSRARTILNSDDENIINKCIEGKLSIFKGHEEVKTKEQMEESSEPTKKALKDKEIDRGFARKLEDKYTSNAIKQSIINEAKQRPEKERDIDKIVEDMEVKEEDEEEEIIEIKQRFTGDIWKCGICEEEHNEANRYRIMHEDGTNKHYLEKTEAQIGEEE